MERTVAVFYEGAVAHYNISENGSGDFTARLLQYSGSPESAPPSKFHLVKEGRHWMDDDHAKRELVDEIGYAIELQYRGSEGPIFQSGKGGERNEGGRIHPST